MTDGITLLDTVALLFDEDCLSLDDRTVHLVRGQVGTVVENADSEVVIVEFAGTDGVAYALASIACTNLLKLRHTT